MTSDGTSHGRFRRRAVPLVVLLVVTALFRSTQNAFQTTIGPIGHTVLNLDPSVIGVGIALAGAVTTLASLFLVVRLRATRLRTIALTGLTALATAIVLIVFGRGLSSFLISSIIFGMSGGLVIPVLATLAGRVEGVSRDRAISAYTVALSASLAVGPFFESIVLSLNHDSLKGGLLSFLPLPLLALVLFTSMRAQPKQSPASTNRPSFPNNLYKSPQFRLAAVALLLYQVPFVAITAFGALIARYEYGITVALAQVSFTVFFLVSLATRSMLVWKHPGDKGGSLLRLSAILTFAGTILLAIGHNVIFLFTAIVFLGVPHGFVYPLAISTISRSTSPRDVPKANAALFATQSAASVVSPILLGATATLFGYQAIALTTLVPVSIFGILLFMMHRAESANPNFANPSEQA